MIRYFQRQISEIAENPVLQLYGFALTFVHALTLMFLGRSNFSSLFSNFENPVCWPYFPSCSSLTWSSSTLEALLWVYGALIVATFICFSLRRVTAAYVLSAVLLIFKFSLLSLSYQFMGNYHYMPQLIQLLWLLAPHKVEILRLMLVAFYVAAGTLKLNLEWLSGATLLREPMIKGPLLSLALFYVPLLEIVLIFGLLAKRRWIQILTLAQLAAFHAFSWHIVGDYYPMVMLGLLSFFVFLLLEKKNEERGGLDALFGGRLAKTSWVVLGVFAFAQLFPAVITQDAALSGAPRIASLNMLDAWSDCSAVLQYRDEKGHWAQAAPFRTNNVVRIACDPLVFLNETRLHCAQAPIKDARLILFSKRSTDRDYKKVLDVKNACDRSALLWAEVL